MHEIFNDSLKIILNASTINLIFFIAKKPEAHKTKNNYQKIDH